MKPFIEEWGEREVVELDFEEIDELLQRIGDTGYVITRNKNAILGSDQVKL